MLDYRGTITLNKPGAQGLKVQWGKPLIVRGPGSDVFRWQLSRNTQRLFDLDPLGGSSRTWPLIDLSGFGLHDNLTPTWRRRPSSPTTSPSPATARGPPWRSRAATETSACRSTVCGWSRATPTQLPKLAVGATTYPVTTGWTIRVFDAGGLASASRRFRLTPATGEKLNNVTNGTVDIDTAYECIVLVGHRTNGWMAFTTPLAT